MSNHLLLKLANCLRVFLAVVLLMVALPQEVMANASPAFGPTLQAPPGDVDGNGVVDLDDARLVTRYVAGEIDALPHPENADATQDGSIGVDDALAIAQRVTGHSRLVVVTPGNTYVGSLLRIEVSEHFFPFYITGGTVRIISLSTGYDSGDQPLTFEYSGRALYYHWDTDGLSPASDYEIYVTLTESEALGVGGRTALFRASSNDASQPQVTLPLSSRPSESPQLAQALDAYAPAPGIALEFRRVYPQDSAHAPLASCGSPHWIPVGGSIPWCSSMGGGWMHNYDIHLEEFTNGRIAFVGANGFIRWFQSNADGTYTASPGDYAILTRDPDGTFQLREKDGFIYHFRSNLRLDYLLDTNGNRVSAIYDGSNRLVEIRHSSEESFFLEYNAANLVTRLTDQVGRVTTYEYNSTNEVLTKVIDPTGKATEYTYQNISIPDYHLTFTPISTSFFRLASIAFPDGTRVQYEYDSQARLVRQTGAWGANPVSWSYDEDGTTHITDAVTGTITIRVNDRGQPLAITDPDGGQTQLQYDSSANLVKLTEPLTHTTQYGYDSVGNIVTITNPLNQSFQFGYDPRFNEPSSITNPLGQTTRFDYDGHGNLLSTTYPDTRQESYTFDPAGNLASYTDAMGKTITYSYNSQGLMTSLENALGGVTQFSHNTAGDLIGVTDANGHVVSYAHDTLGRVTRMTYADGSREDYEYDAMDKVTAYINRRGERISFSYDVTGRLEWKIYPGGERLHFQYDDRGVISKIEAVTGTQPITATVEYYEYNLSRRLTLAKVSGETAPESYDVSYAYDAAGNRKYMAYPDGYGLNYEYDAANCLTRISDASHNTVVAYQYDAAGRRTRRMLGNGTYATYEYDALDRLTRLANYAPGGTVQSQFEYTYNAAGMRTSMTTLEGTHSYTYDDADQLTGVEYPDGRTVEYAFDAVGNRTVVTDTGVATHYTTNPLDQYTQVGGETSGYDADGNLITRTLGGHVITYGWDADDRLVSVDRDGIHVQYSYDYQGLLVTKTVAGQETRYVWDGLDLVAEMDSAGNVTKRYIYGANINEVIVVTADGTTYWGQQDGLGSVVGTTDDSGGVAATSSYDVYGNVRGGDLGPVPQRFAGMWWDEDAGLYYVRARWYEPSLGRFISTDPIQMYSGMSYHYIVHSDQIFREPLAAIFTDNAWFFTGSGVNLYSYALNAPTYLSDPDGLHPIIIQIIAVVVVVAYIGVQTYAAAHGLPFMGSKTVATQSIRDLSKKYYSSAGVYSGAGGGDIGGGGGGVCPTFIQLPSDVQAAAYGTTHLDMSQEQLAGKITVPIAGALLRADIPIFGVAGGIDFQEYRVEYGEGSNPTEWQLIASSTTPQPTTDVGLAEIPLMQGDVDLRGNLATWNTGLKNWVHLPWHPPEDPTDLNGVYTLRLVVTGKGGQTVEDRMTVEVGRAIAQALPGIALSPDQRVVMRFPEQSLTYPFRVYSILPLGDVGEETPPAPKGAQLIGPVYRIGESGDRFIKDVALEFTASETELSGKGAGHFGIARYDVDQEEWLWVPTVYSSAQDTITFTMTLTELPMPEAIYALVLDPHDAQRSHSRTGDILAPEPAVPVHPGVLIEDAFEANTGSWKPRDRFVGATLARDNTATPDGSYALKLTNESYGGNFSVTVLDRPFDVREYPVMNFNYRIPPGVQTDFYLQVNGRWYNLGFTDDPTDFRNRDVNIGNLGQIKGIIADDQWHSASVNLYQLLRQKTQVTQVGAIMMADWDIGGYMKLEFGRNARGATYYIDNFIIAAEPASTPSEVLMVNNFDATEATNLMGGPSGTFSNPGTDYCQAVTVEDAPAQTNGATALERNRTLQLTFDASHEGAYCGYWTALMAANVEAVDYLSLRLRAENVPPMYIGLRHAGTGAEATVPIQPYMTAPDQDSWRTVTIPLSIFLERGLPNLSLMDTLFVTFKNDISSGQGTLLLDDFLFRQATTESANESERNPVDYNFLLAGGFRSIENGAAAISAEYQEGRKNAQAAVDAVRISYGGTIGLDYGGRQFSYAIWETDLFGFDARAFQSLVLNIRGEKGGEKLNIYLDDGITRRPVRAKDILALTTSWQEIYLPLESFASQGVDLSHLEALQIVFEWAEMSGTIYVAEIRFGGVAPAGTLLAPAQTGDATREPEDLQEVPFAHPPATPLGQPTPQANPEASDNGLLNLFGVGLAAVAIGLGSVVVYRAHRRKADR